MATKSEEEDSGMMMVVTFLVLFVLNSLVVWLASSIFPGWVVLGTLSFTLIWALIHSMGVLALLQTFALPFIRKYEQMRGKMLSSMEWMLAYFVVNLGGIWLVARFSEQFGFGIKSWLVAVVLAVILDLLEGVVMMQLQKVRGKIS